MKCIFAELLFSRNCLSFQFRIIVFYRVSAKPGQVYVGFVVYVPIPKDEMWKRRTVVARIYRRPTYDDEVVAVIPILPVFLVLLFTLKTFLLFCFEIVFLDNCFVYL